MGWGGVGDGVGSGAGGRHAGRQRQTGHARLRRTGTPKQGLWHSNKTTNIIILTVQRTGKRWGRVGWTGGGGMAGGWRTGRGEWEVALGRKKPPCVYPPSTRTEGPGRGSQGQQCMASMVHMHARVLTSPSWALTMARPEVASRTSRRLAMADFVSNGQGAGRCVRCERLRPLQAHARDDGPYNLTCIYSYSYRGLCAT